MYNIMYKVIIIFDAKKHLLNSDLFKEQSHEKNCLL
jgi:hypothetical protein